MKSRTRNKRLPDIACFLHPKLYLFVWRTCHLKGKGQELWKPRCYFWECRCILYLVLSLPPVLISPPGHICCRYQNSIFLKCFYYSSPCRFSSRCLASLIICLWLFVTTCRTAIGAAHRPSTMSYVRILRAVCPRCESRADHKFEQPPSAPSEQPPWPTPEPQPLDIFPNIPLKDQLLVTLFITTGSQKWTPLI